jgi:hypothetical protein
MGCDLNATLLGGREFKDPIFVISFIKFIDVFASRVNFIALLE